MCVFADQVQACQQPKQQRKLDLTNDMIIYEADINALNGTRVARTLQEARALGPIVTPKQYRCSFCGTGTCGVVVNTIQCFCGTIVCQPATTTTTTGMNLNLFFLRLHRKKYISFYFVF